MHDGSLPQFVRLTNLLPAPLAVRWLPEQVARSNAIVPLRLEGDHLVVAVANLADQHALRAVEEVVRRPVQPLHATYPDVRAALDRIYGGRPARPRRPELAHLMQLLGLSEESLERALVVQASLGGALSRTCLSLGLVEELDLAEALAWQHGLPHIRLDSLKPQPGLAPLVPWDMARDGVAIPLWWLGGALVIGTAAPEKQDTLESIANRLGAPIRPVVCPQTQWSHAFRELYLHGRRHDDQADTLVIDALLARGILSELDLAGARALSQQTGQPLAEALLGQGLVSRGQWLQTRSQLMGVRLGHPKGKIPAELAELLPAPVARTYGLMPLDRTNGKLIVGMQTPDRELIALVESLTGLKVDPRLVDRAELMEQLGRVYGEDTQHQPPEPEPGVGELLVTVGRITEAQLEEALEAGPGAGGEFGEGLVSRGLLDEVDLVEALSLQTGLPYARLEHARFDQQLIRETPPALARRYQVLPLLFADEDLWVAVADPLDGAGLQAVEKELGVRVWPLIAPRSVLSAAIDRFFSRKLRKVDPQARRLVHALVDCGILAQKGASSALARYAAGRTPLDRAICEASGASETEVATALAGELGIPVLDLQLVEQTVETMDPLGQPVARQVVRDPVHGPAARLISLGTAKRLAALPVARTEGQVTVAFADPVFGPAVQELEATLGLGVRPGLAPRGVLQEAIQRLLGRRNIGTHLLLAGIITPTQLSDALDLAQLTGVRLGRALMNRGYVTQKRLYEFLAEQANLPLFDLSSSQLVEDVVRLIDPETARACGMLPIAADRERVTLAMVDALDTQAMETAAEMTGRAIQPVLVTEQDMEEALERIYRSEYLARSTSELLERSPEDSAYRVLSRGQRVGLGAFLLLTVIWLALDYRSYLILVNALSSIFYLSLSAYKFYLVYRALHRDLEVPVSEEEVAALDDRDLPVYTILIPAYKEAEVLPDLLEVVSRLDYPTTKLDVKVLMEADDLDTIEAFRRLNMPSHFQGIVVPSAHPKTKPKACNYGLIHARGEYIVILDAEDLPELEQLKRVLVAYSKAPPNVACIQAKLNYYNRRQNLLTRWFTVEYSMWFDLFLPGLDATGAPIPLGGTSNHFRRNALVEVGAWDPHNVTEDADLGVRLYKRGYRTATVDSTTFEEANSELYNWVRQRSRWHKGYIQTWLVHMRHPLKLLKEIGPMAFLSFQLVVGGTFFAALLNPVYWALTALWFLVQWNLVQEIAPAAVFYVGAICMYLGNFAFMYMNVAGAMRRKFYDQVKYALLTPLYWGLMSVGAWKGFLQLIYRPHYWEKTVHGLSQSPLSVE
jgi:cellulose synthase/poly-beta-1,6-N-acetylglucosamine synthase-like glycosyltransferase